MKLGRYIGVLVVLLLVCGGFFPTIWSGPRLSDVGAAVAQAQTLTPAQRATLQAEYDELQKEIAQWQKVLDETKAKKKTLTGDVTALTAKINEATAQIKAKNVAISQLADQIVQKSKELTSLQQQMDEGLASLGKLIRQQNESDTYPLATVILSSQSLSDVFDDVQARAVLQGELQQKFDEIRNVKTLTQKQRDELAAKQNAQEDAKHAAEVAKAQVAAAKTEKTQLLAATSQQEAQYQTVLADRQRRAQEIKNALFNLRDSAGISFETALNYATVASKATGVRAALILAILSQESDLGANIGSCYVSNLESGDGVGKNSGEAYQKVMKSPRDTVPFKQITDSLGLAWASTPVSCPLSKVYSSSRGYGGAVGPSQFIPSTWQIFAPRIDTALGISEEPNPWDPQHAVMATALYMKDLGAAGGTYTAERNAACKYYSGRACDSRKPTNYTYGNSVVAKADKFQENIDFLNNL